jgi:DHA1 family tetracycline resistance protein-like MFS transporter
VTSQVGAESKFEGRRVHLLILGLCGFVTSFGAHIVATNLPSYAATAGVGAFMIGLVIAVYDFAELFAKPAAGFVADRAGMKRTLMVGLVVFIVGSASFLVLPPSLLLLTRFIQGLGAAALSTVSITLVAKYFARSRGRAFGVYNALKGAGYVIAPTLGGLLVHAGGFSLVFTVSAAVGLVALLSSLLLPADARANDDVDDDDDLTFRQFLEVFRDRLLLPVYAVIVINMFLVGILFGFLPVYLHGIGFTPMLSGVIVSAATGSYLVVQPFAGHLGDRLGMRVTVIGGLVLAATCVLLLTFTSSAALLAILAVVAGLGVGTVWTNTDALVSTLARERKMGASIGAAQSFKELGDMVGPLAIGAITQVAGVRVGFVSCGAAALCVLAIVGRSRALSLRKPVVE